jgi:hypothetical protein
MIPFNVKVKGQKASISWDSLFWFFVVTAGATVVGELVYQKWVTPYLSSLPSLPGSLLPPVSRVVSSQTPGATVFAPESTQMMVAGYRNRRGKA